MSAVANRVPSPAESAAAKDSYRELGEWFARVLRDYDRRERERIAREGGARDEPA